MAVLSVAMGGLMLLPWPFIMLGMLGFPVLGVGAALRGGRNGAMPGWFVIIFVVAAVATTAGALGQDTRSSEFRSAADRIHGAGRPRPGLAGRHHAHRRARGEPGMSGDLGDLGRFAEPSLLILVSLSDRPKHGYAIMEDLEAIGGTRVGPGTLYAALARLESRGLIKGTPHRRTAVGPTG